MPQTTISAGMSVKRPGQEQYSSDGYHLTVEMEAEVENADHFRAVTQALFAEVKASLEAEVAGGSSGSGQTGRADLWGSNGNGGNGREPARTRRDAPSDAPPRDRSRSHAPTAPDPISNKQAKYVFQLARRSGMKTQADVAGWIHEKLGVDRGVYELTKKEASKAIDLLNNNGKGGNGK